MLKDPREEILKLLLGLLLGFVLLALAANALRGEAAPPRFDPDKFYRFLADADKFNREYQGCDPVGFPPTVVCIPGRGVLDAALWSRLQHEGRALFGKEEK